MNHDVTQERNYTNTAMNELDPMGDNELGYADTSTTAESSEDIRTEIERTRSQMSSKIDSLQNRFSPETLKAQAQDTLRSAVEDGSNALMNYWRENQAEIRYSVVDVVKRNPIPAALIGVGVGWAVIDSLANRNKPQSSAPYSWNEYRSGPNQMDEHFEGQYFDGGQSSGSAPIGTNGQSYGAQDQYASANQNGSKRQSTSQGSSIGEKVSHVVEQVREGASQMAGQVSSQVGQVVDKVTAQASELTDQAQQKTQQYSAQVGTIGAQAQQKTQQAVQSNPLAVGGVALVLGALIGMLLPGTERENEMMGDLRNQVADKAQTVVGDVKQRVQQAVDEAKPEVKNLANKVVGDVKQHMQQAIDDVKPEFQNLVNKVVDFAEGGKATEASQNNVGAFEDETADSTLDSNRDRTPSSETMLDGDTKPTTEHKSKNQRNQASSFSDFNEKVEEEQASGQFESVSR